MFQDEIFTRDFGRGLFAFWPDCGECFRTISNFRNFVKKFSSKFKLHFEFAESELTIQFHIWILSLLKTYGAVHMPAAHISTDGCEALSAIQKFPTQRFFFAEAEQFPLQRKIPGTGNFSKISKFRDFVEKLRFVIHGAKHSPHSGQNAKSLRPKSPLQISTWIMISAHFWKMISAHLVRSTLRSRAKMQKVSGKNLQ